MLKCGGIFKHEFVANLLPSRPVKNFENRIIVGEVIAKSLVSCFFFDSRCREKSKRKSETKNNKKLSYRRGTARCVVSVEICQLPRNSAETTCTTSPEQIEVMKLNLYSKAMCNKHVHSTIHNEIESLSLSRRCHKQTDDGRVVDITCIPTTCCGEIF